uniref:Uncharacterized protein n=1 Tax=Oryza brachyantha TaxID=4533 RepID=J3M4G6_ORYBR
MTELVAPAAESAIGGMGGPTAASETDLKGWLVGHERVGPVMVDHAITSSQPSPPPPLSSPVWRRRGKTRLSSSNRSSTLDLDADVDTVVAPRRPSLLL